jgi:hypothetical protein
MRPAAARAQSCTICSRACALPTPEPAGHTGGTRRGRHLVTARAAQQASRLARRRWVLGTSCHAARPDGRHRAPQASQPRSHPADPIRRRSARRSRGRRASPSGEVDHRKGAVAALIAGRHHLSRDLWVPRLDAARRPPLSRDRAFCVEIHRPAGLITGISPATPNARSSSAC